MKKIIIMLICSACISISVFAQKISADKLPASVLAGFKAKFPNVTKVSWEMEDKTAYEADFKLNNVESSATFSKDGKWMETEMEIKLKDLPLNIQQNVAKQFPAYKINECSKIEHASNGLCFEVEITKGKETFDVLYNSKGEILSKTKTNEKDND